MVNQMNTPVNEVTTTRIIFPSYLFRCKNKLHTHEGVKRYYFFKKMVVILVRGSQWKKI